jgi:hypothetical protein
MIPPQLAELHKKFPFLIHILIVCIAILVMRSVSEKRQISHLYFLFFVVALFGFMFVGLDLGANPQMLNIFKGMILIMVSITLIYGMFQANSNSNAVYMTNKVLGLVGLMIPLVGLGMLYNKFKPDIDDITNRGGISGFLILFLFYIPCLISDFATYLKTQLSITTSPTYLLLGLEILLILAFVYFPTISKSRDTNLLLENAFLDKPRVIASSADLNNDTLTRSYSFSMWIYTNQQPKKQDCNIFRYGSVSDGERTSQYNLNTRLRDEMTMEEVKQEFLAANPQSYILDDKSDEELKAKFIEFALEDEEVPIDKEVILRKLSDKSYDIDTSIDDLKNAYKSEFKTDDYPLNKTEIIKKIHARDGNALNFIQKKRETLMQELSDIYDAQTQVKPQIKYISSSNGNDNFRIIYSNDKSHDVSIRSQKWNNFVITYNGTEVDMFVNGNLERSAQLDAPIQYSPLDQVVVGDENGIDGAICNVCFFPKPLTSFEIANSYNSLSIKNPPINV